MTWPKWPKSSANSSSERCDDSSRVTTTTLFVFPVPEAEEDPLIRVRKRGSESREASEGARTRRAAETASGATDSSPAGAAYFRRRMCI